MLISGLPKDTKDVCVLLSGGVDSALLLQVALLNGLTVTPVHVACGFVWEDTEKYWLGKLLEKLQNPRLNQLKSVSVNLSPLLPSNWAFTGADVPDARSPDEAVFIPGRNLILFTLASLACHTGKLKEIWIGSLKQNPFSDTSDAFFRDFEKTCRSGLEISLAVRAPFRELEKSELLRRFPDFPYELTFSCIQPRGLEHCGVCNKCAERQSHLKAAGIEDKTNYSDGVE